MWIPVENQWLSTKPPTLECEPLFPDSPAVNQTFEGDIIISSYLLNGGKCAVALAAKVS